MKSVVFLPCLFLALFVVGTGCMGEPPGRSIDQQHGTYSVDDAGVLSLRCPPCQAEETILSRHEGFTTFRVVFRNPEGDVYAIATVPDNPVAGFVLAPGAGVRKEGHLGRAEMYATHSYAYLILDVRGNGGETDGYPMDLERDFMRFMAREWPQYYLSACDISCGRAYLQNRSRIPVYAVGESNGGRYAAIAAAVDSGFAGYIGVSTSGFSRAGDDYTGDARRFLLSVDPENAATMMAGRNSWIFHAPGDTVIPFSLGRALYDALPEPKSFFAFNGTHGQNEETDALILEECAQIYGPLR